MGKMNRSSDKLISPDSPENLRKLQRRSSFRASLRRMGSRLSGQKRPWPAADYNKSRTPSCSTQQVFQTDRELLQTPSTLLNQKQQQQPTLLTSTKQQTSSGITTSVIDNSSTCKLPVVSFYALPLKKNVDMRFIKRKPSIRDEQRLQILKKISKDNHYRLDILSPNSRMRVDRLVRKFGPEVLQMPTIFGNKQQQQNQQQQTVLSAVNINTCNSDEVKDFRRTYKIPSPKYVPQTEPLKRRSLGNILEEEMPKSNVLLEFVT
ncbi:hypothetical protein O3M35_006978 [Rhynocoris fuscipes]|uniref:Uncharacterized protein n=1 Tax=Rhynocoris fuscipes TaxID=488301 RepID=A0AAW1DHN6_9HEMI